MSNYSDESLVRLEKINRMRALGVIPYANKYDKIHRISDLLSQENDTFRTVEEVVINAKKDVSTAGRIILFRSFGKIAFAHLQDSTGQIQIMFSRENCSINTGTESKTELSDEVSAYKFAEKFIDLGDFIGVKGELFHTHKGELTLFVTEFTFLAKAVRPLPEKFHGLEDQEIKYRQRYLDLISNEDAYNRMLFRSEFIRFLRAFYHENNFMEIETPILGNAASGAAAKPFITHHNDFDEDFFLRISPETSLKKATVGRFERVFEIGKQFRNEGSDPSHLQEFTSVEHYAVYWNYEDNMRFTEKMFDYLFENLKLPKIQKVKDKDGFEKELSFATPWQRVDYIQGVKDTSGIDITTYEMDAANKLRADIRTKGFEFEGMNAMGTTTLIDYLFKKVLRPKILGPAFIYNYPKTMQPLARASDANLNIVEQFQVIVNGWEILKAYSELVDPIAQKANFDEQSQAAEKGDQEATASDNDFVLAMEYGMPPQSGWGMGIDRIITLLTEQENLRDSILFPLMKGKKVQTGEKDIPTKTPENGHTELVSASLSTGKDPEINSGGQAVNVANLKLPSHEQALALIEKYSTSTKQHLLQVGTIMKYFAEKLGQDAHYWWLAGALHDIDWDFIGKDGGRHLKDDFNKIADEIYLPEVLKADIRSHAHFLEGITEKPDTLIRKYLNAVDELSGFLWAYFRMLPSTDVMDIKPSSIQKKLRDVSFAAGVNRNEVKNCETMLSIPLESFIEDMKLALKGGDWMK